jgi:hypothetical protein
MTVRPRAFSQRRGAQARRGSVSGGRTLCRADDLCATAEREGCFIARSAVSSWKLTRLHEPGELGPRVRLYVAAEETPQPLHCLAGLGEGALRCEDVPQARPHLQRGVPPAAQARSTSRRASSSRSSSSPTCTMTGDSPRRSA